MARNAETLGLPGPQLVPGARSNQSGRCLSHGRGDLIFAAVDAYGWLSKLPSLFGHPK